MANVPSRPLSDCQSGVGLIEILIAVVLISLGFLATARMQIESMRFSQSAYFQTQASFLANEMADRMRSNLSGVMSGYYSAQTTSDTASNPQCEINDCQPLGIAQQDLFDWSTHFHSLEGSSKFVAVLPGSDTTPASGQIIDTGNGVYAIVIHWNETLDNVDQEQSFRLQFALEESQ